MNEKVKVLYFVDRMLKGGIQALVIEIAKNINKEKIQLDFLLLDDGNKYELEETLTELGCCVYKLEGVWIRKPFDFIKYSKAINNFFKEHNDYKVVHLHSSSKNYMVLKYAKKYEIPIRIAHSHNINFQTRNKLKKMMGNTLKILLKKYATDYFACSKLAGEWLFGEKIVNSFQFKIIHNAIDYEKFKFNEEVRNKVRNRIKVNEHEILIGNVGRFTNQKNHSFLIEIFNEIVKVDSNFKLILIGKGEKEEEIKEKVKRLNIESKVIFLGFQSNVNEYMQAMDLFLMPSLHEGLPVVGIEAQAAGLPIFTSQGVVTEELKITSLVKFISLKYDAKYWANKILESNLKRKDTWHDFKQNEYFIEDTIKKLEDFYLYHSK